MKVLIICKVWGYAGGREQYLVDVVEELTGRGHTCCVIYADITDKPIISGLEKCITQHKMPSLEMFETRYDEQNARTLCAILDLEKPDVIFMSDVKNYKLLSTLVDYGKIVNMAHNGWLFCLRESKTQYFSRKICSRKLGVGCLLHGCFIKKSRNSSKKIFIYNSLSRLQKLVSVYSKIRTNLVASQYMKSLFLQHGFGNEQVEIVGYPIELPPPFIDEGNMAKPNVLFIGRIDRYKGVDFLLQSLGRLNLPFTCNIIGDGPYLSQCKNVARNLELGDVVNFLGWLPRENTKKYIKMATVIVVPSIWPEPFGIVGLEAMACGKPVIAFNSGGISDWLEDGKTGYLISPKDTVALAYRIENLLRNTALSNNLGAAGRLLAQNRFNKAAHFGRLIRIFEETAKKIR